MSDDNARGAFAIKSERDISAHILQDGTRPQHNGVDEGKI